ncbi:MAG: phosphoribosylformylglycinamidine cyclo-ligase [bacterium]
MSGMTYKDSGVDTAEGGRVVERIKNSVKSTFRPEVMNGIGGFSSMVKIPEGYRRPVLVSGTDGVGTKLKLAFMANRYDSVGIDLVAMCFNDIVVSGAEPLYFLDYFATGKLDADVTASVVEGVAEGCRQCGAALVGGETAEMPGFYKDNEFDIAGFGVGVVEQDKIIDGSSIKAGDVLVGIPSSGIHSNGYSLVRRILFDVCGLKTDSRIPDLGKTVAEEFLTPTFIYADKVADICRNFEVKGMVHITGGGFFENIPRVLPEGTGALINGNFEIPPVFKFLKESGKVEEREMFSTFNCGFGFICVLSEAEAEVASKKCDGEILGIVCSSPDGDVSFAKKYF